MTKFTIAALTLFLFSPGVIQLHAQTTSAASKLVAQPIPDRTVLFNYSGTGVAKPIDFGLDLAWLNEGNLRRGIAFMGKPQVRLVRSSFTPTDSLINGDLKPGELNTLNTRLSLINTYLGKVNVVLNCDHPSVSSWYIGNAPRWAQLIDVTTRRTQDSGHTVLTVSPFNEPDYGWGQYSGANGQTDFYNIAGELRNNPRFNAIRISGGNTLNCDQALPWYNFLKLRLNEGNTHQLAGSFDNFASFYQTVRANGHHATGDELHNVMEAMVGAEYGMQTGIWWGTAELARGEFVKASDGVRLGYAEHRPNWTAASVYRASDGKVKAFGGTSERQAVATSYSFVSRDKDVYYEGYGPQREYNLVMPGGIGYQNGQTNAERVVNITWGEDIQPSVNGRYVLVNRGSGKVMEVPGGSITAGVFLQQNNYVGATYQQWNITPVSSRIGGDFSYFTLTAAHSGKAIDIYNWSLDNGGSIDAWDDTKSTNQQWYFDYVSDGWFYIRSRHSAKCLEVSAGGVNIDQWDVTGGANQQWRLLPVDAAIEFIAPATPANLVAAANAESIRLNWTATAASDLAGYHIYRSETAGGPYNTIARNVQGTSFVDNTATSGGPYYYKIKAVDKSLNRSAYSNEVSATPAGSKDLVLHLPFNGNTLDTSINLNHSAAFVTPSYTPGKVGSGAVALNGTTNFIQLPATIANQQEITVTTWVYWNGGGAWQRIFDFGNDQLQNMFLTPSSGSGTLRFAIKNGGAEQILDAPALTIGQWSHVTVTLGVTGARMYVNGNLVAQSSAITIRPIDFMPVSNYIGRSQYPDPLFNGNIDDFNVFNYALSAVEASNLGSSVQYYQLRNRSTGLYLDGMGRVANGSNCGQYANTTSFNSHWDLVEAGNGYYQLQNRGTGLFLDGMGRIVNGDACGQWANSTHPNSNWEVIDLGGGYYQLKNRVTSLFVDGMGRTANGSDVAQWANTTGFNSQWQFVNTSSGQIISQAKQTLAVEELQVAKAVLFYPNPTAKVLYIRLKNNSQFGQARIFNLTGQLIKTTALRGLSNNIEVSGLPSGSYVVEVVTNSETIRSKFIKQ